MQIRAGNRQDEPQIRSIIFDAMAEFQKTPDLQGRDRDLANIESSYFWFDGFCLVAEKDGKIIGVIAAKRGDSPEILQLSRLFVLKEERKKGVAGRLMETACFFAQNMEYRTIQIPDAGTSSDLLAFDRSIMEKLGFQASGSSQEEKEEELLHNGCPKAFLYMTIPPRNLCLR